MPSFDGDVTQTSRGRLLSAAKTLFSRHGYEQTSTAAIARDAGSSESQLIRYFGGKNGVLEAIFNDGWNGIRESLGVSIADAAHGRDAVVRVLGLILQTLGQDDDLAFLFLLEGRRIRGNSRDVILSTGFTQFMESVVGLVRTGQQDGSLRPDLPAEVLATALLGGAEAMMRERVLAQRHGVVTPFDDAAMTRAFSAMAAGLAPQAG